MKIRESQSKEHKEKQKKKDDESRVLKAKSLY